jgi:PIN domain nuclease of toxin-antitoxin system
MIVLDTHTLVWWVNGEAEALSIGARKAIEAELEGGRILVSSISAWELAMLVARGRLALSMDVSEWLAVIGQIDSVSFVPVDNELAIRSAQLPGEFHKDPADRLIVATARRHAVPVITADAKIRDYPHVRSLW